MELEIKTTHLDNNNLDSNEIEKNVVKTKQTRNRLTKKQQFSKEREELINQLNSIIGIDDKKNYVYLYDLENNAEIEKKIKNNIQNIKTFFKTGKLGYFSNDISRGKDNTIGLLRS